MSAAGLIFAAIGALVLLLAIIVWVASWSDSTAPLFALGDDDKRSDTKAFVEFAVIAALVCGAYWLSTGG